MQGRNFSTVSWFPVTSSPSYFSSLLLAKGLFWEYLKLVSLFWQCKLTYSLSLVPSLRLGTACKLTETIHLAFYGSRICSTYPEQHKPNVDQFQVRSALLRIAWAIACFSNTSPLPPARGWTMDNPQAQYCSLYDCPTAASQVSASIPPIQNVLLARRFRINSGRVVSTGDNPFWKIVWE